MVEVLGLASPYKFQLRQRSFGDARHARVTPAIVSRFDLQGAVMPRGAGARGDDVRAHC